MYLVNFRNIICITEVLDIVKLTILNLSSLEKQLEFTSSTFNF